MYKRQVYPNRRLEKTNDSPVRGRIESEENAMMPLVLADTGEELTIQRIGGSAEVKRHLENLGFVAGGTVTVSYTHLVGFGADF